MSWDWKTNSFCFRYQSEIRSATFSQSQQELVNSGNKIPFPKTSWGLNFQLKNIIRGNHTALAVANMPSKAGFPGNAGDNILSGLLKRSSSVRLPNMLRRMSFCATVFDVFSVFSPLLLFPFWCPSCMLTYRFCDRKQCDEMKVPQRKACCVFVTNHLLPQRPQRSDWTSST